MLGTGIFIIFFKCIIDINGIYPVHVLYKDIHCRSVWALKDGCFIYICHALIHVFYYRFHNQANQEDKVLTKADVCCWKVDINL